MLTISWGVLGLAFLMPKLRQAFGLPRPVALGTVALGIPAAAVAVPPGRARGYATFLAQMWAYLRAFELAYAQPERMRRRLLVDELVAVDRALGAGRAPTERLQGFRARWRARDLGDLVLGTVYFAWALERHAVLTWIAWRHPARFARAAALVAATFDLAWIVLASMPAAPPWWAGKAGRLPGVRRVTVDASQKLPLIPEQNENDEDQGNPWASTPSQHEASAVMIALVAAEVDPRAGMAAWGYAAALGLALVYLGEHYLFDVLTGAALAAGVHRVEPVCRRPARGAARWIDSLATIAWPRRRWLR